MRALTYVVAAATLLHERVSAQVEFELGPFVGVYAPTGSFESEPLPGPIPIPSTSRHLTGFPIGGRGVVWIDSRVGLAAEFATASSAVRIRSAGREQERPARVKLGAIQLVLPLHLSSLRGRGHLGAGAGLVWRSGDFYEDYEPQRNAAAVLGAGSNFPWSHRLGVLLNFQSYLYSLRLRPESTAQSTFQADLLAQVGLLLQLQP